MRARVWESEANVTLAKTNALEARESCRTWRENPEIQPVETHRSLQQAGRHEATCGWLDLWLSASGGKAVPHSKICGRENTFITQ